MHEQKADIADIPPEATSITKEQMLILVKHVLAENKPPQINNEEWMTFTGRRTEWTADKLFYMLQEQNALSQP